MAKKIRFPLEMENGVEVRSMEELRENFSLARVISYIENGKLVTWLRDRYANDIADEIENLDKTDPEIARKVSEIFEVSYEDGMDNNLEKETERIKRIQTLKQFTEDKKYIEEIDSVAFNQDEMYDLLDDNVTKILLCGERFSIPLAKADMFYEGINNPVVVIDSKEEVDWEEKRIILKNVKFDEKYESLIKNDKEKKDICANEKEVTINDEIFEQFKEKVCEIKEFSLPYPDHRFESSSYVGFDFSSKREAEQAVNRTVNRDVSWVEQIFSNNGGKVFTKLHNLYLDDLRSIFALYEEASENNELDKKEIERELYDEHQQLYNECYQWYASKDWYNLGQSDVQESLNTGGFFASKKYRATAYYKIGDNYYDLMIKCSQLYREHYMEFKKHVFGKIILIGGLEWK